jgi:hypothetical protein
MLYNGILAGETQWEAVEGEGNMDRMAEAKPAYYLSMLRPPAGPNQVRPNLSGWSENFLKNLCGNINPVGEFSYQFVNAPTYPIISRF